MDEQEFEQLLELALNQMYPDNCMKHVDVYKKVNATLKKVSKRWALKRATKRGIVNQLAAGKILGVSRGTFRYNFGEE